MKTKQPENKAVFAPVYQIRIQETLDNTWADWFDDLSIIPLPNGTMLHGPVIDQAALNGLLNKIYHLNLTLLSVQRIEPGNDRIDSVQPVFGDPPEEPQ